MEFLNSILESEAWSALPRLIEGMDRFALIAVSILATAIAVGTVARNHEFELLGKILVAVLIFVATFAMGLAVIHYAPAWIDMARMARGLDRP